ncbi:MAG TPA: hypothetical protein VGM06_10480 [Polyangiaceae bacterium]
MGGDDSGPGSSDRGDEAPAIVSDGGDSSPGTASDGGDGLPGTSSDGGDGSPVTASDGGAGDASVEASACPPPVLYPPSQDGGIYCPFSAATATRVGAQTCANGSQMCCVSPSSNAGVSSCEPFGATCPVPVSSFGVWQCSSPQDCVGAPVDGGGGPLVCCLVSGYTEVANTGAGCPPTYKTAGGFDSVTCTAASQCVGTKQLPNPASDGGMFTDYLTMVCEANEDCVAAGAGSTCTPVLVAGTGVGLCTLNLK